SGAVVAAGALAAFASSPVAGTGVDRVGGRATVAGAMSLAGCAFFLFPLVRTPWQAFALSLLAGCGEGSFRAGQSALLAGLTPAPARAGAFGLQRLARNLGIGIGSLAGGLIASTAHPATFTVLFVVDG